MARLAVKERSRRPGASKRRLPSAIWHELMCHMAKAARSALSNVSDVLGGREVLKKVPRTNLDLVESIRGRLAYAAFEAVAQRIHLTAEEAASSLAIPRRTLARRKSEGTLDPSIGERVVRLARIAARALEVFDGDDDAVARWMRSPLVALGNVTPLSLVDTDLGAQEALDVLGRLEHGVFS